MVKFRIQRIIHKNSLNLSPKERLLKYLIENKKPQSILSVSSATVYDYKNTYNLINQLKQDVIYQEKIGNTNLVRINLIPNQTIYQVENKRTEQFFQENKAIRLVLEDIKSVNYPFLIALLFGSMVKKTSNSNSDIDLCIISDNKEKIKEIKSRLGILPIKLELHDFSTGEFESMLKTKELNISKEIVKNNIILYGVENYYNLISKWIKNE